MRRALLRGLLIALAGAGVLSAAVWRGDGSFGIASLWRLVGGDPDQGPVDFATLERRSTPNDALVCPADLCEAVPDISAQDYLLPPERLRALLKGAILASPGAVQVAEAQGRSGDRFVVRTPVLRFPDTVEVLVVPRAGGRSSFALYSRSLLGRSDMGTNLRRIRSWLAQPELVSAARPG